MAKHRNPSWCSPANLCPTRTTWTPETREIYRLKFPRAVTESDYTKDTKISGLLIQEVPLHKVLYSGLDNYGLRLIANGMQVYFTPPVVSTGTQHSFMPWASP